jgi:tetratricopeptide (TPR) repeat protein
MRKAAVMEAATEKHPVTPGEVLPAHELLADMLFEMGRYQEAQTNYQTALERSPNRLKSLYGAGRSAELAGDKELAALYYGNLVEVAAADSELTQLQQAKAFLGGK